MIVMRRKKNRNKDSDENDDDDDDDDDETPILFNHNWEKICILNPNQDIL